MPENNGITREQALRKMFIRRVIVVALILTAIIIAITIAFNQFKLYSNARLALREAKNVKMTLEMVDLEYYGAGINIYDESAEGNIREGALAYVKKMQGNPEGTIKLTGYDSKKRKITGFEYELKDFIVRYTSNEDGDCWQVCQIKELLTY